MQIAAMTIPRENAMLTLTLLEGHEPLAKKFNADGSITSYPLVKKVTSHTFHHELTLDGLRQRAAEMRKHANLGLAMLKGPLTKELNRESRSGHTDVRANTQTLVIDIDGVELPNVTVDTPLHKNHIQSLANRCVQFLPSYFHNASYIVHASSSLGMKGNKVSLHLEFYLSRGVAPSYVKRWLQHINLTEKTFASQLDLTATGTALRWKLDVSLADNTRLIYIAPPHFDEGLVDPIPNRDDRIFLVEKNQLTIDPPSEIDEIKPEKLHSAIDRKIEAIRNERGLPKSKAKYTNYRYNSETHLVVTNPDECQMTYAYENDKFVYYNMNGGDSNAYYVYKYKPEIVWNFKGEPPFLFEQAAPELYEKHLDTYIRGNEAAKEHTDPVPIAFNDRKTDVFYRGFVCRVTNSIMTLTKTTRQGAFDWLEDNNAVVPDTIPIWDYIFDPTDHRSLDMKNKFINQFTPSKYLLDPIQLGPEFKNVNYDDSHILNALCPNIYKVIRSVTGQDDQSYKHFVNWLAYLVCEKKKPQTAWVLHGTEGTGKGLLFTHILRPMLGEEHAVMVRLENLDEQFNGWMDKALLVMVDEFKQGSAKKKDAVAEKLRNYITEEWVTIRGMHASATVVKTYMGWILAGNDRDMLQPGEEDRRYNIAPRQNLKLFQQYPELRDNLHLLTEEMPAFASFLLHFNYVTAHVRQPMDNDAKRLMRASARTIVEDFFGMLQIGDLEGICGSIMDNPDGDSSPYVGPAKTTLRALIKASWDEMQEMGQDSNKGVYVSCSDLKILYEAIMNRSAGSIQMFNKMLTRFGFIYERVYIDNKRVNGLKTRFHHLTITEMYKEYVAPQIGSGNNVIPMSKRD